MNKSALFFTVWTILITPIVCFVAGNGFAQEEQFSVKITYPNNGGKVGREIIVEGIASIPKGNYLWVLARRADFEPLWWPQREAKIDPNSNQWKAAARFGEMQDTNWEFDIGAITVNAAGHRELMDYWITAMKTGTWRPIQIPETTSAPRIIKVRKVRH